MKAHKCPVCNGRGLVPYGFYQSQSGKWTAGGIGDELCKSCHGSGVVWHEDKTEIYDLGIDPIKKQKGK